MLDSNEYRNIDNIREACRHNDFEKFKKLCIQTTSKLVSIALGTFSSQGGWDNRVSFRTSCMQIAVEHNNLQMIRFIIEKGADINSTDLHGRTPLFHAIRKKDQRNLKVIDALLNGGADPTISVHRTYYEKWATSTERSPLEAAVLYEDFEVVDLLLEHGMDINTQNVDRSIVHFCAALQNIGSFKAMLKRGANPHSLDYLGRTALHLAFESFDVKAEKMALYLINEVGIDVNIADQNLHTALCYSMKVPFPDVAEAFTRKGALVKGNIHHFANKYSIYYDNTARRLGIYPE